MFVGCVLQFPVPNHSSFVVAAGAIALRSRSVHASGPVPHRVSDPVPTREHSVKVAYLEVPPPVPKEPPLLVTAQEQRAAVAEAPSGLLVSRAVAGSVVGFVVAALLLRLGAPTLFGGFAPRRAAGLLPTIETTHQHSHDVRRRYQKD